MEKKYNENTDSNYNYSSKESVELTTRRGEEIEQTQESIYTVYDIPKKSHNDLRKEKINELNVEYQRLVSDQEYEKAITIMKKLIFFESESN